MPPRSVPPPSREGAPLRWRLPNAAALFVGREAERKWLLAATRRGPVTVVTGPGGVGKTTLVRHTLHASLPTEARRALNVQVPAGESPQQAQLQILRALSTKSDAPNVDWRALQSDPEAAFQTMLDLAEASAAWVVLDDLYQDDVEGADGLLAQLASFGRDSRWIVTSRRTPSLPELLGQVLALGPMREDELMDLARGWAPLVEDARARVAVSSAAGSPWILYQHLAAPVSSSGAESVDLLVGLSAEAIGYVFTLSVFDVAVPRALLATLAGEPEPAHLDALVRRGLVEESPGGLKVHDVARGLLQNDTHKSRLEAERQRAATALATSSEPEPLLEALRLLADLGRVKELVERLDAHAERLLGLGYAPRLWKALSVTDANEISEWRLKCAAELGNPTALAQVAAPRSAGPSQRLAWARTLLAEGDVVASLAELDGLCADAAFAREGTPWIHASLLRADALHLAGRYADAVEVLSALGPIESHAALRDAALARARIAAGEGDDVDPSALRASALADGADPDTIAIVAEVLASVGRLDDARRVVRAALGTVRGAQPRLLSTRRLMLVDAQVALARGSLTEAAELVEQIRPYARGASVLAPCLHALDAERRMLAGDFENLAHQLDSAAAQYRDVDAGATADVQVLRIRAAIAMAEDVTSMPPSSVHVAKERQRDAWQRILVARARGPNERARTAARRAGPHDPTSGIVEALASATDALVAGDAHRASASAVGAERDAERWGMLALRAEALCLLADSHLCAGRAQEMSSAAELLSHLASQMSSARFAGEASFFAALAERPVDAAVLQGLAARLHVAPVAARRSRALLGGPAALDHIDLRALESIASWAHVPTISLVGSAASSPEWTSGWGIDERSGRVWLEDGSTVELGVRSLSFKILDVLVRLGGAATKEQLVVDAWGEREYHALRHDGKIHVGVRKLRELLGDTGATASRVVTTADGYALGGVVRVARAVSR